MLDLIGGAIVQDVSKQAVRFYKTSRRKRSKKHVREEIADLYLYVPIHFRQIDIFR